MCTVAVVACSGAGYIVAHNRDERRTRSRGIPPSETGGPDARILCPRDPDGGGTWVAVNRAGLTLCMLNAPDLAPEQVPESPVSRGTIPLELTAASSLNQVRRLVEAIDLARYRPFHLVAVSPGRTEPGILELRWNGIETVWIPHRPAALFVSSSLRQISADRARGQVWDRFIAGNTEPDMEALAAFMENHEPEKSSLSTCMHREDAVTVSRTMIRAGADRTVMQYKDGSPCNATAPVSVCCLLRTG